MSLGLGGAQEWRFGLEQGRHVRFRLSERCPQSIAKLAVQICCPDLHEHVSTVERPAHLLLLDHPFADERVHRGLGEGRGDAKPGSVALSVVDDRAAV